MLSTDQMWCAYAVYYIGQTAFSPEVSIQTQRLCNWVNLDTGDQLLLHFAFHANWYTWNLGIIVLHKALEIMVLGLQQSFCQILLNVSAKSRVLFPHQLHVNTVKRSNKFKYKKQNQKQTVSALWCETHTLKPVYTGTC